MNDFKNDIEELKNTLDAVLIENSKNTAHLMALTEAFEELAYHLLNKDELSNLKSGFYNTLYEKTSSALNDCEKGLYHPAKVHFALLEMKEFVNAHLKED